MGETKIEWSYYTFNAWIGCAKVDEQCRFCYAEQDMDKRRGRVSWGLHGTRSVTSYDYWRNALKWNREAEKSKTIRRVFSNSLADIWEKWAGQVIDAKGNPLWWPVNGRYDVDGIPCFSFCTQNTEGSVPLTLDIIRGELFKLIARTPWLDWMLLSKRTENAPEMLPRVVPENIWFGASIGTQASVAKIADLVKLRKHAKHLFLSCEPLLERINMAGQPGFSMIDMVIVGGESGHNRRPFDPAWAGFIQSQCEHFEIAFFMKQWDKIKPVPEDLMIRQFPEGVI